MFNYFEFLILPWVFILICFTYLNFSNHWFTSIFFSLLSFSQNSITWSPVKVYSKNFIGSSVSILNLAKSQAKNSLTILLSILCVCLFLNIILSNLIGLTPFQESISSGLGYTLFFSFSVWFTCVIVGISFYGIKFIGLFIPGNSPWVMSFLFVLLEIVSFSFRAISLGVRLWANMTAGHSLLQILTSMSLGLIYSLNAFVGLPVSIAISTLLSILVSLEYLISILQSGVFIMLTGFYLNEVYYKNSNLWSNLKF